MEIAYDMIFSLQEMFAHTSRAAWQSAIRKLFNTRMVEGTLVWEHMLKVMGYLYEAIDLGAEIDHET